MTDWSNRFMLLLLASSTDCEYKNITIQIDWIIKNRTHKSCHSKLEFLLFPFILIHKVRFYYYYYYLQMDTEMKFTQIINSSNGRRGKRKLRESVIRETRRQRLSRGREWSAMFSAIENRVAASGKLRLRDSQQHNWPVLFKNVNARLPWWSSG